MSSKQKLSIDRLQVMSFVTSSDREKDLIKGGISVPHPMCYQSEAPSGNCCPSDVQPCP